MIKKKPLLKPGDFKPSFKDWKINGVLNPGGVRGKDGRICLYVRVAETPVGKKKDFYKCPIIVSKKGYHASTDEINKRKIEFKDRNVLHLKGGDCRLTDISHLKAVYLDREGFNVDRIDDAPAFTGIPGESDYGVEDARIVKIGRKYYMTYVAVSKWNGVSSALAVSSDLKKWKREGIIFQEQNKDVVLFPEKIKGRYVALNRPESAFGFSKPSIWISYSKDLIYWGREQALLRTRDNSWEDTRNGAGPPPLKTKKGWLVIYHGVHSVGKKLTYSAGAALLDLKNPENILARTPKRKALFSPTEKYERGGFVKNVVFPTAMVESGRDLLIYSGGGDSVISVRKISLREIFRSLD